MDYTLDEMKICLDLKHSDAFAHIIPGYSEDIMYRFMDFFYDFQSRGGNIEIDLKDDKEKVWLTCTFGEVYIPEIDVDVLLDTIQCVDVFEVEETIDNRTKISVGLKKLPEYCWDYEETWW